MARESRTPFVILGILNMGGGKPLSGYDIKQVIDGAISHFWAESYGQIYPVLKRLAADKLICAGAVKRAGRKRSAYAITAKGRIEFSQWMQRSPEHGPRRDELILKLFLGSKTEIPALIRHLVQRRDQAREMGDQYSGWLQMSQGKKESDAPFQIITLRAGIAQAHAFVRWADESLAILRRIEKGK
jgi:DNA-binding PadR family transcriptional regulator